MVDSQMLASSPRFHRPSRFASPLRFSPDDQPSQPKRASLAHQYRRGNETPRDQKRLRPLIEIEDALGSPPFEYERRELGGRSQQVIRSRSLDSKKYEKQEIRSQSVIIQSQDPDYSDSTPAKIIEKTERSCLSEETLKAQIMGELEEVDAGTTEMEQPKIAVAAGKGQSGLYALKWVLNNLVSSGGVVYLLHVQPPLRFIPTPMGNTLPVEKISDDIVNKFKMQRFMETEKLLDQYRKMCTKRQVKPDVCYSESDSIQEQLVDQISSLGIAKLVLGTSSHNLFTKAFKGRGISSYVAKHAPEFCTVMVVDKGKLCSVREATKSDVPHSLSRTPTSLSDSFHSNGEISEAKLVTWHSSSTSTSLSDIFHSNGEISEEETSTTQNMQDMSSSSEPPSQHRSKDDLKGTGKTQYIESASVDFSNAPARWLSLHESTSRLGFHSPPAAIRGPFSGPIQGAFRSAPQSPQLDQMNRRSVIKYPSVDIVQTREDVEDQFPMRYLQEQAHDSTGPVHELLENPSEPMIPSICSMSEASVGDNGGSSNTFYKELEAIEVASRDDINVERSSDNSDLNERQLPQSFPQLLQTNSEGSTSAVLKNEDVITDDIEELKRQLEQATLSAKLAQTEAVIQANRCKQKEDLIASAMKMVSQYDAQRKQELQVQDDALRDVQTARQQAAKEARRCEEALFALEEAKEMIKVALEGQEICRKKAEEEAIKHQETLADLEESRRMVEVSTSDAEAARQLAAVETRKYEEAMANFEEVRKALEVEFRLRKEAEEKALQEAVSKQEALAALRKSQQRYILYSFEELQAATDNFQEGRKLGEGGFGSVYKGKIHHTTVAVKVLKRDGLQGQQEFQREVELLSRIHHPHMVMLLGACPERACIVYEYMANGNLEDRLNCKDGTPPLPWYVRFRICSEIATALLFLHSRPEPIVHRDLKPGNILLDHNLVSKIGDVGLARLVPNNVTFSVTMYKDTVPVGTFAYIDPDYQRTGVVSRESDVYALGIVMLQLLTGKGPVGVTNLVEEAVDDGRLQEVLDKSAGEWPLAEAMELACLSLQCAEPKRKHRPDLENRVLGGLENIRILADAVAAAEINVGSSLPSGRDPIIPSFFICPISQEIMEDPTIAADGFTYEREVIQAWLNEHNTSPMTNLRLSHKNLIPNYSLRSAIREWSAQNKIEHA